jgi:hypothetical protein
MPSFATSRAGVNSYAVYDASPYAGVDAVAPAPVMVQYIEPEGTDLFYPAAVAALAVAGYAVGRMSSTSAQAPEEDLEAPSVAMLGVKGESNNIAPPFTARREFMAKAAGAALASLATVQGASAKSGQFGKQEFFSVVGQPGISSPYQPGGPKAGADATFGYAKSDGPKLATGYENDVTREKADFEKSAKIVRAQGPNIESKTWWLARDNFRGQAYNMKANMKAINKTFDPDTELAATKAYKKFWDEVQQLDFALRQKEPALAKKEYADCLEALKVYEGIALK